MPRRPTLAGPRRTSGAVHQGYLRAHTDPEMLDALIQVHREAASREAATELDSEQRQADLQWVHSALMRTLGADWREVPPASRVVPPDKLDPSVIIRAQERLERERRSK